MAIATAQAFMQDFYKYIKGDANLHPAKKKMMKNLVIGVIGTVGVVTIGSYGSYRYFFKKQKKKELKSLLDAYKKREEVKSLSDETLASLDASKLTQVQDPNDKKILQKTLQKFLKKSPRKLKKALANNDINGIKEAIEKKALFDSQAYKLLWEIQMDKAESIDALYYLVANYPGDKQELLNYRKNGQTLLQWVIAQNMNHPLAEALMNLGSNVNVYEDITYITPLMRAAESKNIKLFIQLVAHGAKLQETDIKGKNIRTYLVENYGKNRNDFLNKLLVYKEHYPDAVSKIEAWVNKTPKVDFNDKEDVIEFVPVELENDSEENEEDYSSIESIENEEERKKTLRLQ